MKRLFLGAAMSSCVALGSGGAWANCVASEPAEVFLSILSANAQGASKNEESENNEPETELQKANRLEAKRKTMLSFVDRLMNAGDAEQALAFVRSEPPRVLRRVSLLSRMDHHEQDDEQIFP